MKKPKLTIEEVLIEIPDHPDLLSTVENEFTHYLLRRDGFYYCGVCGNRFGKVMSQLLIGNEGRCPSCHSEVALKQITRRTNWNNLTTEHRIQVMQVHQGRIAFRQYEAVHSVSRDDLREHIAIKEIQRDTIYKGQIHQNRYWESPYRGTKDWGWGWINENDRTRRPKKYFHIYPTSMIEVLKDTEVKFTGVGEYLDKNFKGDRIWWYAERLIANAAYVPWIEYVQKMKLSALYDDLLNGNANMIYIRPNLIKRYRQWIKESNASAAEVMKKRMCEIAEVDPSSETLKKIESGDIKPLVKLSKRTGMSFDKLAAYLGGTCNNNISYSFYEDYLNLLEKIGTPATTEATLLPKDFRKAHDEATDKFNTIKNKAKNDDYAKLVKDLRKLKFEKDGMMVVVPDDLNEILKEGKDMSHCVGTYIDRVAEGRTVILFIRRSESPFEAFYTMEYSNGKIIQVRGKHNAKTTDEVDTFTKAWLEWTKRPKKKPKREFIQMQPVAA